MFLEDLKPDALDERYNSVRETHGSTCSWVLNLPDDVFFSDDILSLHENSNDEDDTNNGENNPVNDLARDGDDTSNAKSESNWSEDRTLIIPRPNNIGDWLRSGAGTYWLSGKPGSGKSALMKYIIEDERTAIYLRTWAGDHRLVLPIFFFWKPGRPDQKSLNGFLRSLIYHILVEVPELLATVAHLTKRNTRGKGSAWTLRKLEQALDLLFQQTQLPIRFCLFIDGLDELEGDQYDQDRILRMITQFTQLENVKACISSRPWLVFEDLFKEVPKLRLHEVNYNDICLYVNDTIAATISTRNVPDVDVGLIKDMQEMIVEKSDGVFLWAVLAVQHLARGLQNGDNLEGLMGRLRRLDGELDGLFDQLLHRIEKIYAEEAALYMQFLLQPLSPGTTPLSTISFATDIFGWDPNNKEDKSMTDLRYSQGLLRTKRRILATCAGLVCVEEDEELFSIDLLKHSERAGGRVVFIHRSVIDYLKDTENGKAFVTAPSQIVVYRKLIHSKLGKLRLSVQLKRSGFLEHGLSDNLDEVWTFIRAIEKETGAADQSLVLSVHRELEHIYTESMEPSAHVSQKHWIHMFGLPIIVDAHCSDAAEKLPEFVDDAALFGLSAIWDLDYYVKDRLMHIAENRSTFTYDLYLVYTMAMIHSFWDRRVYYYEPDSSRRYVHDPDLSYRYISELVDRRATPHTSFKQYRAGSVSYTTAWKMFLQHSWQRQEDMDKSWLKLALKFLEFQESLLDEDLSEVVERGICKVNGKCDFTLFLRASSSLILSLATRWYPERTEIDSIMSQNKRGSWIELVRVTRADFWDETSTHHKMTDWNDPPRWLGEEVRRLYDDLNRHTGDHDRLNSALRDLRYGLGSAIEKAARKYMSEEDVAVFLPKGSEDSPLMSGKDGNEELIISLLPE